MTSVYSTPERQLTLSAELRNVISEHHIFTTRTRIKGALFYDYIFICKENIKHAAYQAG
jgi:hypothetical protein